LEGRVLQQHHSRRRRGHGSDDGPGFLNLNFGGASPGSACGIGADNFSARWTRTVNFAAGTYRFTATVDNGLRLYVDGQLKITQWADLPPNTYTADVALTAGNHEIKLEFVEYTGGASATLSWAATTVGDLSMALIDPGNRIGLTGKDLLSRNCNWSLPLLSLPGRAGLDLGLALSLNSLVYTRAGSVMHFDPTQGFPAPGFTLGFPEIRNAFINTDSGIQSYLLSMPSGSRVEFRQIDTNVYEAVDSSYMLLTHDPVNSVFVLHTTDGTQLRFEDVTGLGDYKCKQIKDRNGNFITIGYGSLAEIRTVTDALNRGIIFDYDGSNHLLSITQNWGGQTHTWATFAYGTQTIQTNFPGLTLNGTTNGAQESVLLRVGLSDGTVYSFEYNTYAQVKTIRRFAPNNSNPVNFPGDYFQRSYTTYGLPDNASASQTDCPRATSRTDWAYDWNQGETVTSFYTSGPDWGQVEFPDGTIYKESFATTGWQRGLITQTENWAGGVRKKWTTLQWTQDNTGVSYRLNPRVTETNVYDNEGNRRRATTSYTSFGLPSDVYEYDADATTVLRHMRTEYNLSAVYVSRRIIGLPSAMFLYDGGANLFSKVDYQYDLGGGYQVHQGPPVQHDTPNYGAGFVQGRGNLNVVRRWNVTDPNNALLASEYETGYNTSGSVIFTRDPLDHQSSVSYADSFSDGQNNRNTYAYPTTMTDPDNFSSTVQYNFDFGAVTRTQDPKGAAVTLTYDAAGRIERTTRVVNGAYTRYVYRPDQREVETFTTINDLNPANEFRSLTVFDGHDRVKATMADHPGSVGLYKAQLNVYDAMGRLAEQTNPTEVNSSLQPAGDDAAAGWVWRYQSHDWQGRLTLSTDQEGNTKEYLYGGCGCAGGQVVVTRDEVGRRQKMTYDILGRLKTTQALFTQPKSQPLNGDGDVYSTQVNTYNVRDQITQVSQIAQSGGASQITTMEYDGHGRLWKKRAPIESGDTVYEYNPDDTVFRVTDARQAAATLTYNARHLIQDISYTVPTGVAATPNVHYDYDENGNRTLMNDGLGTVNYSYDLLSRMESETRYFTELARSYSLTYAYNLAGQVKRVSFESASFPGDNTHVYYDYNNAGEMTAVTGSPYAGVTQYVTEMKYRASGAGKSLQYGNNRTLVAGYNSRQQLQSLQLKKPDETKERDQVYQYYPDGRIKYSDNSFPQYMFARAFSYDHVGRLQEAWTGIQARNFINQVPIGTDVVPYHLAYQYDVWGNQLSRTGKVWSADVNESPTYQNNRRSGWQYDATGKVLNDGGNPFLYDAAGRNVSIGSGFIISTNAFDGDGLGVRRDPIELSTVTGSNEPIFYMRSTVLGGKVIAEINGMAPGVIWDIPRGGKLLSYVYQGASMVAIQQLVGSPRIQRLEWRQVDPITGTQLRTADGGDFMLPRHEPDPHGVHVGFSDPAENPPPPPDADQPSFFGGGEWNPNQPRFTFDGRSISELLAIVLMEEVRMRIPKTVFGPGTPPFNPGAPPAISWGDVGDALFDALQLPGIVNIDPRTPGFGDGFGFLAGQQQGTTTQLPDCAKAFFKQYFPNLNLDKIVIHTDGLPEVIKKFNTVPDGVGAFTYDNHIYFPPNEYDPYNDEGLVLLGHEVTHVDQFQTLGRYRFLRQYVGGYIDNIRKQLPNPPPLRLDTFAIDITKLLEEAQTRNPYVDLKKILQNAYLRIPLEVAASRTADRMRDEINRQGNPCKKTK
jgi:YD repeat-containing protein